MDFMTQLLQFLTAAISFCSAVVAVLATRKSRATAQEAEKARAEMDALYNRYLRDMSEAARSTAQINEQTVKQLSHQKLCDAVEHAVSGFSDNFFTIDDVETALFAAYEIRVGRKELIDILSAMEQRGAVIELSQDKRNPSYNYHRVP